MIAGIYGIFDSETNECLYVGRSKELEKRRTRHFSSLRNGKHGLRPFQDHVNSIGFNRLNFKILEITTVDLLSMQETYWFEKLSPRFYGTLPNKNTSTYTESSRRRKSESHKRTYEAEVKKKYNKTCGFCGKEFESFSSYSRYCSRSCGGNRTNGFNRFNPAPPIDKDQVKTLYLNEELSAAEISRQLEVGRSRVQTIIKELGIVRKNGISERERKIRSDRMKERFKNLSENV